MTTQGVQATGGTSVSTTTAAKPKKPQGNLTLSSISIINPTAAQAQVLYGQNANYYRENGIFGDIATKPNQYPNQTPTPSQLRTITQATPEVEDVTVNVTSSIESPTARDLKGYDIAAKPAGVGGFTGMNGTDAYNFFLQVNADDFTARETEYKGKKETHHYFDSSKSDGKISVFSSEIRNGQEYLAMRDKDGNVHYFDKANGLKEVTFEE